MTDAIRYQPSEPIDEGRTIIEASAGTGKTFTIAAAVTRLLAEEGRALERILVVTFTRAATAELKDRIRRRMVGTLRALRAYPDSAEVDEHMRVLIDATPERRALYAERLDEALTRFDRAQIFTIHGFAQRLLRKLGFRSRLASDLEPGEIDELLVRRAASDLVVGRFAATDGVDRMEGDTARDLTDIGKALAGTPDARIIPEPTAGEGTPNVRAEMAREMKITVARRLRAGGMVTYDDGLVEARDALTDSRIGADARALLQRRYSLALIDESQDTDPIQWQVIRAVFDDSRLVVIGDPKQSIYAFRGADIESYLSAADNAAVHRTLETNWRSDGPLITALDALLAGATFGDPRIAYRMVQPAERHRTARINGAGAALEIRRFSDDFPLPRYQYKPFFLLNETRIAVAADVATETVRLLTAGVTLNEDDGERPIGPGDIAVLCRTRRQIETVRNELTRRGVPSVAARAGSVFATPAAEQWRRFLHAVERPNRTDYVRMAATTSLVGRSLRDVADLRDDEVLSLHHRFRCWQTLLHDHGVPTLFKDVDRSTGLAARVLSEPGGERMLTDLMHIADEMHSVWRRGRIGSLVVWIEAAMNEAAKNAEANVEDPESRQRRLETDAAAVQVQTIHAAKGLEFPVVLAPYLWDIPRITPRIPIFHDPEPDRPGEPQRRLIDVGGSSSPDFKAHQETAIAEDAAEEGRLLYVALTRARHRLVLWWIENTRGSSMTKLHELLTRGDAPEVGIRRLINTARGAIDQTILRGPEPFAPYDPEQRTRTSLDRARLDRPLDYAWRRVSFSSLSPDHPLTSGTETAEQADRIDEATDNEGVEQYPGGSDTGVDLPVGEGQANSSRHGSAPPEEETPAVARRMAMAELPRGARFGSMVHEVLRLVPFDSPDLPGSIRAELARVTRHANWDFEVDAFVSGLTAAMHTPLGPAGDAPTLRDLDTARTLKEMDFELPLRTTGSTITLGDIAAVALDHLAPGDPHRPYIAGLRDLESLPFRGYLTGGIDLTAAVPGPSGDRYVVIDFKSNMLPTRGDNPATSDYGPAPLIGAMHRGNYVLQALLYQVAVHRYLQWRLDGYDPATHLGGSIYLFVRGMIGADTPVVDGERCGVARWKPPSRMIVAVSDLFAGTGS